MKFDVQQGQTGVATGNIISVTESHQFNDAGVII